MGWPVIRWLLNAIARLRGWNPIGRRFRFVAGEGPAATELTGRTGKIVDLRRIEPKGVEVIMICLEEPAKVVNGEMARLVLVPRHRGYGASALSTTDIAAYVFPAGHEFPDRIPLHDSMIALMDIELCS